MSSRHEYFTAALSIDQHGFAAYGIEQIRTLEQTVGPHSLSSQHHYVHLPLSHSRYLPRQPPAVPPTMISDE